MDLIWCVFGRQAVPKAQQFNQEVLLPAAKYISAELQAQAYEIAVQVRQPGNVAFVACVIPRCKSLSNGTFFCGRVAMGVFAHRKIRTAAGARGVCLAMPCRLLINCVWPAGGPAGKGAADVAAARGAPQGGARRPGGRPAAPGRCHRAARAEGGAFLFSCVRTWF